MISREIIEEVKNRLINVYDPIAIYLFGSYAWGTPTEDSDLDLLVVIKEMSENRHAMMVKGHHALFGLSIPKDILVRDKNEFENYAKNTTSLMHKIKNEGKILYARS